MKDFLVKITTNIPYPKTLEYRTKGSSFGTAIGRAIRQWRKEMNGKKVKEVSVKAIRL
jgi:hypothetical protein